jgi:hypothetical protein
MDGDHDPRRIAAVRMEELHKAISPVDDPSQLPGLPTAEDQDQALRYM